jgi:hypothetical protein
VDAQNLGWLTRILDEMALGAFVFGTADALEKKENGGCRHKTSN